MRLPLLTDLTNSSMMRTEDAVLATAAAAISGAIIFLAWRLKKSCISSASDEKKEKKPKKNVRFAEDPIEPSRTRREERTGEVRRNYSVSSETKVRNARNEANRGMPANRVSLYDGLSRDRAARRLARLDEESSP